MCLYIGVSSLDIYNKECTIFYNFTELKFLHIERDENIVILSVQISSGETSQFFFVEHPVDGY